MLPSGALLSEIPKGFWVFIWEKYLVFPSKTVSQTNFVCSESEAFQCDCLQRDTKKRVQKIHTGIKNCNSILQFILFYATSNNVNQNRY